MKKLNFLTCLVLGCALAMVAGPSLAVDYDTAHLPRVGQEAEATLFAKSIEDLPIMSGLKVVEDKDLLFIFGRERIAQTTLSGRVDVDSVYFFYRNVLPSLGWRMISMKLYEREGERLHLNVSSANTQGMTFVRFEVRPKGK